MASAMATTEKKTRQGSKPKRASKGPEYILDERGRRVGVRLTVYQYRKLLQRIEDLEDVVAVLEADLEGGKPIAWEEFEAQLRAEGKLP